MKRQEKIRIFWNNLYAVRTVWGISRKRVLHIALNSAAGYAEWIFTSIFFLRYVIGAIEDEAPFQTILAFIMICFAVFLLLAAYESYLNALVYPFTDNKIYRVLYRRLYAKAGNVELRCFEDADFYNRYTMALDGAPQKMTGSVNFFFRSFSAPPRQPRRSGRCFASIRTRCCLLFHRLSGILCSAG